MGYMRLRALLKILSHAGCWSGDRQKAATGSLTGLRGNQDWQIWEIHYRNFLRDGWSYLRARNFVHHCTDGPECPVAYAFTKTDARTLFSRFRGVQTAVAHFPLIKYSKWIPFGVEKFLARKMGWYLFIFAHK
jgi:hypothetical protein